MHVLVTGGAGFIGSHSVEALLDAGARVTVFDNFSSGRQENLPVHPRLAVIRGDIRDRAALDTALAGVTRVLHLAAQVSVQASIAAPGQSCAHNVLGFVNVLDAARAAGVERVVYASSAAVYGIPRALPLTEDSALAPISPYGLDKRVDEQYAALFGDLFGQSTLGLRYFNVYGPRQDPSSPYAGVIARFAAGIGAGQPLQVHGDGRQTRDFVFVKDIARANVQALASDFEGVCNVGTGVSVTLLQLIDALAECVGETPQVVFGPPAAGDIRASAMSPGRLAKVLGEVPATALADGLRTLFPEEAVL
jgi:UDP-glucose 4-epimerase